MRTLLIIILLSVSVSQAKELTLDQFVTKVSNEAEAAGHYELDASEVCEIFKNELTNKQNRIATRDRKTPGQLPQLPIRDAVDEIGEVVSQSRYLSSLFQYLKCL